MTDQSVSLFWEDYIAKTKPYKIKSSVTRWYVQHAESDIKAHDNLRFSQHSASHMEKHFRGKGRNPHLENWAYWH
ncbi:MAG: hypothetical protein V3R76_02915 [Gammaproteobacteria bacterium]